MTPQEEQFLQAAKDGNKKYVQANLNNIGLDVQTAAFVLTPSIEISQILLGNGVDINARATEIREGNYVSDWTALGYACENNNLLKIKWLLCKGADKRKKSAYTYPTPINYREELHSLPKRTLSEGVPQQIALYNDHINAAEMVRIDDSWKTSLEVLFVDAVKSGFEEYVKTYLSQKVNPDVILGSGFGKDGYDTPLMLSAQRNYTTILNLLLDAGANITIRNSEGWSAMLYAAVSGSDSCIKILLEAGANPNDSFPNGKTALMLASREGHVDVVKLLLDAQADINQKDEHGYSCFLYAAIGGNIELMQLLLMHGANLQDKNARGATALMLSVRENHIEATKFLLNVGIDINECDNDGNNALKIARIHQYQDIISLLTGNDTPEKSESNSQPHITQIQPPVDKKQLQYELVRLCRWGSIKEVEDLLSAGADVNGIDGSATPLKNAVLSDNPQMVKLLLKHKATVTPYVLQLAENHKNKEIIALLKSAGAKE